jgi:hypothetical protein
MSISMFFERNEKKRRNQPGWVVGPASQMIGWGAVRYKYARKLHTVSVRWVELISP